METGGEELLTREKPSKRLMRLTASTVSHGDCPLGCDRSGTSVVFLSNTHHLCLT